MSLAIVETHGLCKLYGSNYAVKDLNLTVLPNRITAFLGLNGAGKSTTIRMLLGMIIPSSGSGQVLGRDITDSAESVEIRRTVAYVSEDKQLYSYMTVGQLVRFTSGFFPGWRADVAACLMRKYELPADRKVRHLSKGVRQSSPSCWRWREARGCSFWTSRARALTRAAWSYCWRPW